MTRFWRLARQFDSAGVRQVSEGEIGATLLIVYRVLGPGPTTLSHALTRGESSPEAIAARAYRIRAS